MTCFGYLLNKLIETPKSIYNTHIYIANRAVEIGQINYTVESVIDNSDNIFDMFRHLKSQVLVSNIFFLYEFFFTKSKFYKLSLFFLFLICYPLSLSSILIYFLQI